MPALHRNSFEDGPCRGGSRKALHPIPVTRFRSFRTQPLANLSAAVKLPIKIQTFSDPTLGTNLVRENLVMVTWCTTLNRRRGAPPARGSMFASLADRESPLAFLNLSKEVVLDV